MTSSTTGTFDHVDSALADILCLPTTGTERESSRGRLSGRVVRGAVAFADSSGIVEQVQAWREEDDPDRLKRGGRPPAYDDRQFFILMLLLLFSNEAPLITRMTETITSRLDTRSLDLLGLPRVNVLSDTAIYHRIHSALHRFTDVVNSAPDNPGRRLSRAEVEAIQTARDPDECAKKQKRLLWVANKMLQGTFDLLPAETRDAWAGNLALDATVVRAWGKRGSPSPRRNRDNSQDSMSPEIQAGWYHRKGDHRDPLDGQGRRNAKSVWGYELHLAQMSTNDPNIEPDHPLLVLGISMDKPAGRVAENAMTALSSIAEREHPAGYLISDRAYFPGAKPEKLQLPARALGYEMCGDYRDDQLGIQGHHAGAILVEGAWYSPSMPETLIDATIHVRAERIDADTYAERIEQRTRYLFRSKQQPGPDGNAVMLCPARGPGATLNCPLVPAAPVGPVTLGMPTRTPVFDTPEHPGPCCTNSTSITIPFEVGAKYRQALQFGTKKWHEMYSTRNTIEAFNAYAKSPTHEDLEEGGCRRVRGYAFQFLVMAAMVATSNLRKVRAFLFKQAQPDYQPGAPKQRKRRGRSLQDHLPGPNAPPLVVPGIVAA